MEAAHFHTWLHQIRKSTATNRSDQGGAVGAMRLSFKEEGLSQIGSRVERYQIFLVAI